MTPYLASVSSGLTPITPVLVAASVFPMRRARVLRRAERSENEETFA